MSGEGGGRLKTRNGPIGLWGRQRRTMGRFSQALPLQRPGMQTRAQSSDAKSAQEPPKSRPTALGLPPLGGRPPPCRDAVPTVWPQPDWPPPGHSALHSPGSGGVAWEHWARGGEAIPGWMVSRLHPGQPLWPSMHRLREDVPGPRPRAPGRWGPSLVHTDLQDRKTSERRGREEEVRPPGQPRTLSTQDQVGLCPKGTGGSGGWAQAGAPTLDRTLERPAEQAFPSRLYPEAQEEDRPLYGAVRLHFVLTYTCQPR